MQRKSSIHIEAGNLGYTFHNTREKPTANSIFSRERNKVWPAKAEDAIQIYRTELAKRAKKYTERTGKKLHKNTITHLSAIVNLDERHAIEDVKKIAAYLERELGTKVFQIAVHKDEGYVDEEGKKHVNYHAHLELLGLDQNGNSIRRKLTRKFLIELQSRVAEILQMQRGTNYTKERKPRPKRLDTYEYKEHAKRQSEALKEAKKELAKTKDLKELNKRLREQLQAAGAARAYYRRMEHYVKFLKQRIKEKELLVEDLRKKMEKMREDLLREIEEEREKNALLQQEIERLKQEIEALRQKRYRERKRTASKLRALRARLRELQRGNGGIDLEKEFLDIKKRYELGKMGAKEAEKAAWRLAEIAQEAYERGENALGERAMELHHVIWDDLKAFGLTNESKPSRARGFGFSR